MYKYAVFIILFNTLSYSSNNPIEKDQDLINLGCKDYNKSSHPCTHLIAVNTQAQDFSDYPESGIGLLIARFPLVKKEVGIFKKFKSMLGTQYERLTFSTGFLVSHTLILTTAHSLYNKPFDEDSALYEHYAKSAEFYLGAQARSYRKADSDQIDYHIKFSVQNYVINPNYINEDKTTNADYDVALALLQCVKIKNKSFNPYIFKLNFDLTLSTDEDNKPAVLNKYKLQGRSIFLAGYPGTQFVMQKTKGKIIDISDTDMTLNICMFNGHSGSAVWTMYNGEPLLVGIARSQEYRPYTSMIFGDDHNKILYEFTHNQGVNIAIIKKFIESSVVKEKLDVIRINEQEASILLEKDPLLDFDFKTLVIETESNDENKAIRNTQFNTVDSRRKSVTKYTIENRKFRLQNVSGNGMRCFFNAIGLDPDREIKELINKRNDPIIRYMIANEIVSGAADPQHFTPQLREAVNLQDYLDKRAGLDQLDNERNDLLAAQNPDSNLTNPSLLPEKYQNIKRQGETLLEELRQRALTKRAFLVFVDHHINSEQMMVTMIDSEQDNPFHNYTSIDAIAYINNISIKIYTPVINSDKKLNLTHKFIPKRAQDIAYIYHEGDHFQALIPLKSKSKKLKSSDNKNSSDKKFDSSKNLIPLKSKSKKLKSSDNKNSSDKKFDSSKNKKKEPI